MKLKKYFSQLSKTEREKLAEECGTSVQYLYQISLGNRTASEKLAIEIEKATKGKVRCESLCPNADWGYIRSTGVCPAA